jgi:hypothetical protein
VLKEDGEPKRGADRSSKISAREAWAEIRWLHRNAGPRVEWSWCADPDPNEARHGGGIFTSGVLTRELQRGDTCSHDGCGSICRWRRRRSATESRSICAHECGAHLCAAKIECEDRCISGRLYH